MKWEYLIQKHKASDFDYKNTVQDYLNKLGNQGWELIGLPQSGGQGLKKVVMFTFKRPKQ